MMTCLAACAAMRPKSSRRFEREGDLFVELRVFFDAARVFDHDVLLGVEARAVVVVACRLFVFLAHESVVDDDFRLAEFHVAGFGIEGGADDLPALAVFTAVRGGESGRERVDDGLARNTALLSGAHRALSSVI